MIFLPSLWTDAIILALDAGVNGLSYYEAVCRRVA
jgi:hypothetical protein